MRYNGSIGRRWLRFGGFCGVEQCRDQKTRRTAPHSAAYRWSGPCLLRAYTYGLALSYGQEARIAGKEKEAGGVREKKRSAKPRGTPFARAGTVSEERASGTYVAQAGTRQTPTQCVSSNWGEARRRGQSRAEIVLVVCRRRWGQQSRAAVAKLVGRARRAAVDEIACLLHQLRELVPNPSSEPAHKVVYTILASIVVCKLVLKSYHLRQEDIKSRGGDVDFGLLGLERELGGASWTRPPDD